MYPISKSCDKNKAKYITNVVIMYSNLTKVRECELAGVHGWVVAVVDLSVTDLSPLAQAG